MSTALAPGPLMGGPFQHPLDFTGDNRLGPYTQELTKRSAIGARYMTEDGRVFRYAKSTGTQNPDRLAYSSTAQHVAYANIAATGAAGDIQVTFDFAATDGAGHNGVLAEDELENGYIVFFRHSQNDFTRRVLKNTAADGGGDEVTLTLDFPIHLPLTIDTHDCEVMASPYALVASGGSGSAYRSFIGLPLVPATDLQYFYLQTWGPCFIAPQIAAGRGPGMDAHSHQVVARHDGSIQRHETYTAGDTPTATEFTNGVEQQHVGFVLSRAYAGTQGAPFVMLQISI